MNILLKIILLYSISTYIVELHSCVSKLSVHRLLLYLWHNGSACLAVNQMVDDSRLSRCDVTFWSWTSSWMCVCVCIRNACIIYRTWKPDNYLENRHICAWICYSLLYVQWIVINQPGMWYQTQLLMVKFCEIHYICSVSISSHCLFGRPSW